MKIRNKAKHILSAALSAVMLLGSMPTLTYAAQVNEYVDPADIWVSANGRTNELDFNATITQETGWCPVCNKDTIMLTYRTPEYTKSGTTALNRGVKYSDGTMVDGETVGNLDSGRPNQDATYTTYHWTKSVCQTCGTINSIDGEGDYAFSRNVYGLNSCDHNFFLDFDNTTYEPYSSTKHTTTLKRGKYCQFCKGTQARATQSLENHHFTETIDGQLGNNRSFLFPSIARTAAMKQANISPQNRLYRRITEQLMKTLIPLQFRIYPTAAYIPLSDTERAQENAI